MSTNPWKYVQVDADGLENNPYLNPPPKPALPIPPAHNAEPATPVTVTTLDDFLILQNLTCVDADGRVFEQYPELLVRKDIFRNGASQINFTPYQAIVHCQGQGLFLPSMALSCNIVAVLFQQAVRLESDGTYTTINPDVKKVLDQYKDHGAGYGWQAQNTVIDYNHQKIIHYPHDADFTTHGGTSNVNSSRPRTELPFQKVSGIWPVKKTLENMTLEDGLKHPLVSKFVKQFTGLANPSILIPIGQYFQKQAKVWFPTSPVKAEDCTETRAAWFGCISDSLDLDGDDNLNYNDAGRGVRLGAP
ncbi:MAG: hypothetical protein AABY40_02670 [Nanoarchaeota archaeon]